MAFAVAVASASVSAGERGFAGLHLVGHVKLDATGARVTVGPERAWSVTWERDAGGGISYRKSLGRSRFLVGVQGGLDSSNTLEGRTVILGPRGVNFSFEKRGLTVALDGVAGFELGHGVLVFGTLGYATSGLSRGAFAFDVGQPPPPEIVTNDRIHAVTVGFGVEVRLAPRLHFRIAGTRESSQTFAAKDFGLSVEDLGATTAEIVHSAAQVKLGLVFQF